MSFCSSGMETRFDSEKKYKKVTFYFMLLIFYKENNNPIPDMFTLGIKITVCALDKECTLTLSRTGTFKMNSCSACSSSNSAVPTNVDIHVLLSN
jgi:hypothetical protein